MEALDEALEIVSGCHAAYLTGSATVQSHDESGHLQSVPRPPGRTPTRLRTHRPSAAATLRADRSGAKATRTPLHGPWVPTLYK